MSHKRAGLYACTWGFLALSAFVVQAARLVTASPAWVEQKVVASDGQYGDTFGAVLTIDGDTALVGVPWVEVENGSGQGIVYAFTRTDGAWTQTAELSDTHHEGSEFGYFVALSGSTALIGAPGEGSGGVDPGAAYLYTNVNGGWQQTARLTASDAMQYAGFGTTVAFDGTTAAIGAPGANRYGTVYVFARSGSDWNQVAELTPGDPQDGSNFALAGLAVSGDTILVGAEQADGHGAVYVYTDADGTWTQSAKLSADPQNVFTVDYFGESLAFAGNTALIGAPFSSTPGGEGAVYAFEVQQGIWSQTQELTDNAGSGLDAFGIALGLEGDTAVIGAYRVSVSNQSQGVAYVYQKSGGAWGNPQRLLATDAAFGSDFYGQAVGISNGTLVIGELLATIGGNFYQGAAYFYETSDLGLALSVPQTTGARYISQSIVTNSSDNASLPVSVSVAVPAKASYVSAVPSQGVCQKAHGAVMCHVGSVAGNGGTATVNVTLAIEGDTGDTIENTSAISNVEPPLTATAPTVIVENSAPVASDGSLTVTQNQDASGKLKASDPDGDSLTFSIVSKPSHGEVTLQNLLTGPFSYRPDKGYLGQDSFQFKASDGKLDSHTATIAITVKPASGSGGSSGGGGTEAPFGLALLAFCAVIAIARRQALITRRVESRNRGHALGIEENRDLPSDFTR